jgi:predicted RNA-binding Zn-ribbon protein involved in translation (DUF1610 family)
MQYLEVRTEDYIGCVQCGKKIQIRDSYMQYNPEDRGRTRIFFCKECNEAYRTALREGRAPFQEEKYERGR